MLIRKVWEHFSDRFHDMPLRHRLSIPFFFLAFFGTFSLVALAILSQDELIRQEERQRLYGYDRALDHNLELQGRWAVSLASSFARNPEVASALANRDRFRLIQLCYPAFVFMKNEYGICQFNFHILPPRNFVRLQRLYEFGDDLNYRQTITDTVSHGKETFGLEEGLTGYGIRGVAPIYYNDSIVGTVEIGFNFGIVFLEEMKKQFDIEASFLVPDKDPSTFSSSSTTFPSQFERSDPIYARVFSSGKPELLIRQISGIPYVILVRSVQDYKSRTVALVEFCMTRTDSLAVTERYRKLMLGIGILGMLFSVGAIYVISAYFTRPIGRMVTFAREIAAGEKVHALEECPSGELGRLWDALVDMLSSLMESREKIQDYTENLEQMVHLRTRALRESEEKYRTLVESVPLVVYRLLGDGKTIFINHFIEDLMGVSRQEALENANFWKERVWEEDRNRVWPLMDRCLKEGREFKAEYRIRNTAGKLLFVLDHAIPVFEESGKVDTVDGFLVNVTDRHHLQRQIIQTEELRTLTEVSARLAHEIRNPLVAAGGFARRLLRHLPEGDANCERVQIIVSEVRRLEIILEKTLSYLRPFEISTERSSLNAMVGEVFDEHSEKLQERSVRLQLSLASNLPVVSLDQALFKKALETILYALLDYCQKDKSIEVRTYQDGNAVLLELVVTGVQVSEDDIEHFFYPFTSHTESSRSLDLPLAKMIIHKHQGLIRLGRKGSDQLVLDISFPQ
jgi:PAS domain S-box-containing protein